MDSHVFYSHGAPGLNSIDVESSNHSSISVTLNYGSEMSCCLAKPMLSNCLWIWFRSEWQFEFQMVDLEIYYLHLPAIRCSCFRFLSICDFCYVPFNRSVPNVG